MMHDDNDATAQLCIINWPLGQISQQDFWIQNESRITKFRSLTFAGLYASIKEEGLGHWM